MVVEASCARGVPSAPSLRPAGLAAPAVVESPVNVASLAHPPHTLPTFEPRTTPTPPPTTTTTKQVDRLGAVRRRLVSGLRKVRCDDHPPSSPSILSPIPRDDARVTPQPSAAGDPPRRGRRGHTTRETRGRRAASRARTTARRPVTRHSSDHTTRLSEWRFDSARRWNPTHVIWPSVVARRRRRCRRFARARGRARALHDGGGEARRGRVGRALGRGREAAQARRRAALAARDHLAGGWVGAVWFGWWGWLGLRLGGLGPGVGRCRGVVWSGLVGAASRVAFGLSAPFRVGLGLSAPWLSPARHADACAARVEAAVTPAPSRAPRPSCVCVCV